MNIWGKHKMTCQRISRAIRQGSWRSRDRYAGYTFTTPGFKCRIIKNYVDTISPPPVTLGQDFGCTSGGRYFRFEWAT